MAMSDHLHEVGDLQRRASVADDLDNVEPDIAVPTPRLLQPGRRQAAQPSGLDRRYRLGRTAIGRSGTGLDLAEHDAPLLRIPGNDVQLADAASPVASQDLQSGALQ